jgi:uncharacterized membrane protein YfcA
VNDGLFPAGFCGGAQVVTLLYKLWLSIFFCLSVCLSVYSIQLRRRNRQRSRKEVAHDAGEVKDGTYVLKGCCFESNPPPAFLQRSNGGQKRA